MAIVFRVLACLVFILGTTEGWAASGTALGVQIDARVEGAQNRTLTVGADIFIGDRVITDQNGLVQIKFADETELVVVPNSSMVLEDYLLREDGSAGKFAINALAGTFRFVTGNADHDEYSIKTPTGTLGVRGTAFDLFITAGLTRVLMYSGTTILCSIGNSCVTVGSTCGLGQSDATNAQMVGLAQDKSGSDRDDLRSSFPLADNQGGLLQEFQLEDVPECRLAGPTAPAPGILADVAGACDPVIGEQYEGDKARWGECGGAVAAYLATLGPPSPPNDTKIGLLVTALAELFRPGDSCLENPTELPQAIKLISTYVTDRDQAAFIADVASTIRDCIAEAAAAVPAVPISGV